MGMKHSNHPHRLVDYNPWTGGRASLMLYSMNDQCFEKLIDQLGDEIKALRLNAGLSQEALALAADVDRTYVSQLERGVANPSLLILHRISMVLDRELQIAFLERS
jgi:DNA-binding XRE family transcriptional regulator